jgi:hypothetical protein
MKWRISQLLQSAILYLYTKRKEIQIDPSYQRMGEVWTLEKRQLLIDSIINDFDVPKIYFHDLQDYSKTSKFEYAIIDGRQRLEAIWQFIDGDFPLADDFDYLRDKNIKAAGLTYKELATKYPELKQLFDAKSLSIFVVQTDDLDMIEDMFSRLNEAVPLNAAEKRNAFGGPLPKLAKKVSETPLFTKNLKISNKRYQHRDLAAKFIYLVHKNKVEDTKKIYLDTFFRDNRTKAESFFSQATKVVDAVTAKMSGAFVAKDKLLKSSGMVVLYFLLFQKSVGQPWAKKLTRSKLDDFEKARVLNREKAAKDITKADYDLLEFDRLTQTPNDAYAIKFRLELLQTFVKK